MAAIQGTRINLNPQGQPIAVPSMQVSSEFFSILEIPPIVGRTFTSEEGQAGHDQVAILSYGLWQSQFGGKLQIVGQKVDVDGLPYTIIGVMPRGFRVDPDQAVSDVQSMEAVLSDSVASPRFEAILLGVFATLAIVLAIVGLYGVVSCSVSQRTNEIGIRVALGGRSPDIARLVLGEVLALAALALALGFGASLLLSRVLAPLLFEVTPTDPLTLISAGGVILAVSVLAAILPAHRATRVDPIVALRYE